MYSMMIQGSNSVIIVIVIIHVFVGGYVSKEFILSFLFVYWQVATNVKVHYRHLLVSGRCFYTAWSLLSNLTCSKAGYHDNRKSCFLAQASGEVWWVSNSNNVKKQQVKYKGKEWNSYVWWVPKAMSSLACHRKSHRLNRRTEFRLKEQSL